MTRRAATEKVDGAFFLSPKRKLGVWGDLVKREDESAEKSTKRLTSPVAAEIITLATVGGEPETSKLR